MFNLTLKRSNHIKLTGDHMAYESGSFCLPIARICVSFSTLASLNAERGGITKQLMASVHRMATVATVSTVVRRMARRPRHWRLVKARAPGNHCFLRCLPSVTSSTSVWRPQCGPTYIYRHSALVHLHTLAHCAHQTKPNLVTRLCGASADGGATTSKDHQS